MTFHAGTVALVGRPNVGKSTLLNAFVGDKVAIVTDTPQTTRTIIRGILNLPEAQIVCMDSPGLCDASSAMRRAMRSVAPRLAADADVTVLVCDAVGFNAEIRKEDVELADAVHQAGGALIVAINKVDRIRAKNLLLPWLAAYEAALRPRLLIPISALMGDGVPRLLEEIGKLLPEGEALFPRDLHTDQTERFLCEELIREQILLQAYQEVPHSVAVVLDSFEDERETKRMCHLEGRIIVERKSQKGILVGKGGERVKKISTEARAGIEAMLDARIYLRLRVVVDPMWTRSRSAVLGYGVGEPR